MHKVLICIPIYYRTEKVIDCLESILKTKTKNEVTVFLGINGQDNKLDIYIEQCFRSKCLEVGFKLLIFKTKRNIGKPKIINYISDIENDFDYIVSMDSDLILQKESWIDDLIYIFKMYKGERTLGGLCANQIGNCCHVLDENTKKISVGNFSILHNVGNNGVAGGLLITSKEIWDLLNGYNASRVYGADDGHFCLDCSNRGMLVGVVWEIEVYHPFEEDPGYADWKVRACRDQLKPDELNGYYY